MGMEMGPSTGFPEHEQVIADSASEGIVSQVVVRGVIWPLQVEEGILD
jgi:hypothetical protein